MRLHDRKIRGEFWQDTELIKSLDIAGRMFFIGLFQMAEDSGCLINDCMLMKMALFPMDDAITIDQITAYRDKLLLIKKLVAYQANGKNCLFIRNFHKHQTLKNCPPPSVPLPPWVEFEPYEKNPRQGKYVVNDGILNQFLIGRLRSSYTYLTVNLRRSYGRLTLRLRSSSNQEPRTITNISLKDNLSENSHVIYESNNSFGELFDSCDSVTASGEPIDSQESGEAEVQQPKKKRRSKSPSEDAKETAKYLREKLESYGVDHFPRDWLLKNYAIADRLLNNIPKADLMACIDWAMAEQFWRAKTNDMLSIERAYMQFRRRSSGENDAGNGSAFGADAEVV